MIPKAGDDYLYRVIAMSRDEKQDVRLTESELLLRHQLNIAHYWQGLVSQEAEVGDEKVLEVSEQQIPEKWCLTKGIFLHEWQEECKKKWFEAGKRGVLKVVTGAGKTIAALGIIQELQNNVDPDLRVAIVVPTIVLMDQWFYVLSKFGDLPPFSIGRLGGGFKEGFSDDKRIVISVLASAYKYLPQQVGQADVGKNLLLVVDECHRAGAKKMSEVFSTPREYSLGLSATPEREQEGLDEIDEDEPDSDSDEATEITLDDFANSLTGQNIGPIIYELNYKQAIDAGILPPFEVRHYGLPLNAQERVKYDRYSREITELRKALQHGSKAAGKMDGGKLVGWARIVAGRSGSKLAKEAARYVHLTTARKQLLYHARSRAQAVIKLMEKEFSGNQRTRAILFHETIAEVMKIFNLLRYRNFSVVAENSKLPDNIRSESIGLFRKGTAGAIVSARSLIEGVDVPAADVGIIVASSASTRQRIQTIGRVLRKHTDDHGVEKQPIFHFLYIIKTTDESIYKKTDFDSALGFEKNTYFQWDPFSDLEPIIQTGPPYRPPPREINIDLSKVKPGENYPGAYEGREFKCDRQGNVIDLDGRIALNPQGIPKAIVEIRGNAGKFRVTHKKQAVICWDTQSKSAKFIGLLKEPFQFADQSDKYRVTQFRGRRRIRFKSKLALLPGEAVDPGKGQDALNIVNAIGELEKQIGVRITEFYIDNKEVYCILNGERELLFHMVHGLEFR